MTEQQFGNIVIKNSNGTVLHLKDIARIDVGAKGYDFVAKSSYRDPNAPSGEILFVEHRPSAGFAISLQNDANALETISNVQKYCKNSLSLSHKIWNITKS